MKPSEIKINAPFPYYGGKGRWADIIWPRLGWGPSAPTVYVEPFAGSLAILLASVPHEREIIADTSGHVVNFWRSVQQYPDKVAYWADSPTFHHDLTARHRWLIRWGEQMSPMLEQEANWCDPKAAGWWCWGMCNWIGGGFAENINNEKRPHVQPGNSRRGVQVARKFAVPDKRPYARDTVGGRGVNAQRREHAGYRIGTGDGLRGWMYDLQDRLSCVITLNRSWESAVTPVMLMEGGNWKKPSVAVFLDPPYRTDRRSTKLYGSDRDGSSDDVAIASYRWAISHGEAYRIAYAMHDGDFDIPPGWNSEVLSFRKGGDGRMDQIIFSPACLKPDGLMGIPKLL